MFMIHKYDGCADKCPLPLVKTRVILKKMQPNDVCLIKLTDKGSMKNIPNYLNKYYPTWQVIKTFVNNTVLEVKIIAREDS